MSAAVPVLLADSVTGLDARYAGAVLVTGSHGGLIAGDLAREAGVRAVIFSDAGVGLEGAGVAALAALGAQGVAAAAVDVRTARIGDAQDNIGRGIISHVNAVAAGLGVRAGERCAAAAALLRAAPLRPAGTAPAEARFPIAVLAGREVWGLDSASLALAEDEGRILVIGSHGGLVGGVPARALKVDAYAAVYNDAGVGADQSGLGRLPALDTRRIAAATVDAHTARIGDAMSAWRTGVISHVNATASALGGRPGQPCAAFVETIAAAGA